MMKRFQSAMNNEVKDLENVEKRNKFKLWSVFFPVSKYKVQSRFFSLSR